MGTVACDYIQQFMWQYQYNLLADEVRNMVDVHLEECSACREKYKNDEYMVEPLG